MEIMIAVVVGAVIFVGTVVVVRMIANGPPPEPDPDSVHEVEANYRCSVCGMRLTVTHLQDAAPEPPKHCREEMDPV
jgi:uncharacterized protein (UPF0254 family)